MTDPVLLTEQRTMEVNNTGKSFDIDEELSSRSQSVLEVYSEMKNILSHSLKEIGSSQSTSVPFQMTSTPKSKDTVYSEMKNILSHSLKEIGSSQSTSVPFQMTSTPKSKDTDKLSHLHQIPESIYIPFPIRDKISDPEKIEKLCISRANKECDERRSNSIYKSSEVPFMASKKHLGSGILSELSSVEHPTLPIKVHERPKSSLNYTSYHISESEDPLVLFQDHDDQLFKDQTLSPSELRGKHSDTEELESGQLEITDISLRISDGKTSFPVTNFSRRLDHSANVTAAKVPSMHQSNVLLHTGETTISEHSLDNPCWSTTNADQFRHVIPSTVCHEHSASDEKIVSEINTLRNENCNLQEKLKNVDDRYIAKIKDDGFVFRIQELEKHLTESDQLHMQEQRLKSKTFGVHLAFKHLRINEQCLKDENLRYREQISKLKTEKNFLQLRLSRAEQDGEEYVHELNTITDKCEELLNQRKYFQDERNHLTVEKQFLSKEIEDFKREKKRNAEQLAITTTEKDKLVKMLNSTKTILFTSVKEKQELQSRLREVLAENSDLRSKINADKTEKQKMNESKESWSIEETTDGHKLSALEMTDLQ